MLSRHSVSTFLRSILFTAFYQPSKNSISKVVNGGCRPFAAGLFFIISAFFSSSAFAVDVTLAWDPNSEPDVEGYGVYFGRDDSGPPYNLFGYVALTQLSDPGSPFFTVTGLEKGSRYYFAVTAYDSAGNESAFSNPVCADIGDEIAPCSDADLGGEGDGGGGSGSGGGGCFIGSAASANHDRFYPERVGIASIMCMGALLCMGWVIHSAYKTVALLREID